MGNVLEQNPVMEGRCLMHASLCKAKGDTLSCAISDNQPIIDGIYYAKNEHAVKTLG